ncbi:hypothetical protein MRX96_020175 [Rhipicephalus microplus]
MRQIIILVIHRDQLCNCVEAAALRCCRDDQSSGFSRGFSAIPRTACIPSVGESHWPPAPEPRPLQTPPLWFELVLLNFTI